MKGTNPPLVQDLAGLLNRLYPPWLAEEWDNVGLQIGDPMTPVEQVLVALDPTPLALETARKTGCRMLLTHHPLIFKPLKQILTSTETGTLVHNAILYGIAVFAAHTNLDRAAEGLNGWLAERLGLSEVQTLEEIRNGLLKLVVYVPSGHEEKVAEALFAAGAGHIGRYDRCSFRVRGEGTFRAGPGSSPFLGAPGTSERVEEVRLETVVPRELGEKIRRKMLQAHPYEEVAYDLLPLENIRNDVGLGCFGRLPEPIPLEQFAVQIKQALGIPAVRMIGERRRPISKVAVCGGSGASLIGEARRRGAEVLVTGDIKYHEARSAEAQGLALIDAGHFHTEKIVISQLARRLRVETQKEGWPVRILEMEGEQDPFVCY